MQELPVISSASANAEKRLKKPDWLRVKLPIGESYRHVRGLVDTHKLHTMHNTNYTHARFIHHVRKKYKERRASF